MAAFTEQVRLVTAQLNNGLVSPIDLYQAQSQLEATQAQWRDMQRARADEEHAPSSAGGHLLARPTMDFVKKAFLRCHRTIWKSEKMSPQAAFVEFAKLLFVKLWEDRQIRDNPDLLAKIGQNEPLPDDEVRFSKHWIHAQERNTANPIADVLFRQLVDSIEAEIAQKRRKRIFEADERLNLSPGTVKLVVEHDSAMVQDGHLVGNGLNF